VLQAELCELKGGVDSAIRKSPAWHADADLLASVADVGEATLRTPDHRAPRARPSHPPQDRRPRVGGAPINCDSGALRARRTIAGGRPAVRTATLYGRLDRQPRQPVIAACYAQLRSAGKPASRRSPLACASSSSSSTCETAKHGSALDITDSRSACCGSVQCPSRCSRLCSRRGRSAAGDLAQPGSNDGVIGSPASIVEQTAVHPDPLACAPLAHPVDRAGESRPLVWPRASPFFCGRARSFALSSIVAANSFFSLAFSSSGAFSRRASDTHAAVYCLPLREVERT
jgi:hypothetical protein